MKKRLLIMGAFEHSKHLIDAARKSGVYTVITDYVKDAPAKKYADKAYDVSTTDVDALEKLCRDEGIDGVCVGYCDVNLLPYYMLCKRMGYPYYCDDKQLDLTMNKCNFKSLCRRHGLTVTPDVPLDTNDFPVIVKPADSYSSKGISVCNNSDELKIAVDKALSFSQAKQYVLEKFIDAEDVYLYFTIQNGVVSLSAMADRLLNNEQYGCAPQPVGYYFPSKYIDLYFEKCDKKVKSMIAETGLQNGSFFMQGFVVGNDIMFFEMGLRLSGGCGYIQIRNQNGIDQTQMYVNFALTGNFGPWELEKYDNPRFKNPACVIVVLLRDGVIGKIEGLEKVRSDESYIDMIQLRKCGDELSAKGTLNQVFARIYLSNSDKTKLELSIKNIKNELKILDTDDKNMILNY